MVRVTGAKIPRNNFQYLVMWPVLTSFIGFLWLDVSMRIKLSVMFCFFHLIFLKSNFFKSLLIIAFNSMSLKLVVKHMIVVAVMECLQLKQEELLLWKFIMVYFCLCNGSCVWLFYEIESFSLTVISWRNYSYNSDHKCKKWK